MAARFNWHRDPVDMYAYHVEVPQGVSSIEATIDYLSPVEMPGGFSAGSSATDKLAVLSWNWLVLYPKGHGSDEIGVKASLKLPAGWQWASALPHSLQRRRDGRFCPGIADHAGGFAGADGAVPEEDSAAGGASARRTNWISWRTPQPLWRSSRSRPRRLTIWWPKPARFTARGTTGDYHFLLTLSDHVAHFGLEHHESNDSRVGEGYLTDPAQWTLEASLLPHEYTHSWNGKYRRPAGLATPDYRSAHGRQSALGL